MYSLRLATWSLITRKDNTLPHIIRTSQLAWCIEDFIAIVSIQTTSDNASRGYTRFIHTDDAASLPIDVGMLVSHCHGFSAVLLWLGHES